MDNNCHFTKKRKHNALNNKLVCGKPETPQEGLEDTKPYQKTLILINMPFTATNIN